MTHRSYGVGFLGGGPVTQAIHLPTLATLPDRFHVSRVMDVNETLAETVADRCGARTSTTEQEVYDDPEVEVVAICSPNALHARQAVAACKAGKALILCEKPLAVTKVEAEVIATAARTAGTQIVVGTMHAYDPAYRAAHAAWVATGETTRLVQSSIFLPDNDVFINQATDLVRLQSGPPPCDPTENESERRVRMMRAAILGLAIHNIPLLRDVYPAIGDVTDARFISPFGYAIALANGSSQAELLALMPGDWPPAWTFRVVGQNHEMMVSFPPSYVLAGSARAELTGGRGSRVFEFPANGYEAMWSHVGDVLDRSVETSISLETIVDDIGFAIDLADRVSVRWHGAA